MARPRAFDTDEVLTAAMMVFWKNGYEGTTTRMLEEATGVGLRSLFNAFGDKETLFLAILERYHAMVQADVEARFSPPSLGAIEAFFGHMAEPETGPEDIQNLGCLMVNTVFELEKTNAEVRARVEAYRTMWRETFAASLLASSVSDSDTRAEFLVGALWGALSQIKLAGSKAAANGLAMVVVSTVKSWDR